jgi:hypothetical protein
MDSDWLTTGVFAAGFGDWHGPAEINTRKAIVDPEHNLKKIWYLERAVAVSRSAGRVLFPNGRNFAACLLVAPQLILWVQRYASELEKRCRSHLKATTDSWRVNETYVKVKKAWLYLYRAVDPEGYMIEFSLRPTRDTEAAKWFVFKTPAASHTSEPRVIRVGKNAAYPKAFRELKEEGSPPPACELRPVKYLATIVEQDHRFIKPLVKTTTGFLFL